MALIIPTIRSSEGAMTAGEKRLAERLQDKLDDKTICWFNIPIKERYPDFVVLNPSKGLIILEVKDWKLDNIEKFTTKEVELRVPNDTVINPLEQAKSYQHLITEKLGKSFLSSRKLAYSSGVVLTNITRKMFNSAGLDKVLDEKLVICSDEMYDTVDDQAFQEKLWNILPFSMKYPIADNDVQFIRGTLYPEICIPMKQAELFGSEIVEAQAPKAMGILRVMDLHQEQMARSLGSGHRVIHGVAGSGKTLILKYRAEHLAKAVKKPILVMCYNKELAKDLHRYFDSKNLTDLVHTHNFHQWCYEQLKTHECELPPKNDNSDLYSADLVAYMQKNVEEGKITTHQYDAILIDEGHDFEEDWFKVLMPMLNESSDTLLLLYDDAQSIYGVEKKKIKTFSGIGIKAVGRTTILKVNYRNPLEILNFAQSIADNYVTKEDEDEDSIPLLMPESAGRIGVKPQVLHIDQQDKEEEAKSIINVIIDEHKNGRPWREIAVIHRYKFMSDTIQKWCNFKSIPIATEKNNMDGIRFISIHSSKGLEFPFVCIPSIGMPYKHNGAIEDEAKLLYVAITRSTDKLLVTYHDDSVYCDKLSISVDKKS